MSIHTLRVAIQGDRASFHEIAAKAFYTQPIELIYCETFEDTFNQLESGDVQQAFIAVSNSAHGEIEEVKQLINTHKVHPKSSYDLPIQQHLIGHESATIESIRTVVSHPVALSQCSIFLRDTLKSASKTDHHDTSAAVEYVKSLEDNSFAAIASEAAAQLHGMHIITRAIQDDPNNTTTFRSFVRQ